MVEENKLMDEDEELVDVDTNGQSQEKKRRTKKPFPTCPFEESLEFAEEIEKRAGRQQIRRLTLFDEIDRSPNSGISRMLVVNSGKYGLTIGGYNADFLQLTEDGHNATSSEVSPRVQLKAKVNLAIMNIDLLKKLYEQNINQKLHAHAVLVDKAIEMGLEEEQAEEVVNLFIENLKFVGLLKVLSGAERVISLDHLLDELPITIKESSEEYQKQETSGINKSLDFKETLITEAKFEEICFYITPIGDEGSEIRNHADLFYGTFIEPVVEKFNLKLVRADKIDKPGFITKQIIEYIHKSKLVIADLSFNNPNVFYELAIRHTKGLPVVQIMRTQDNIPFDVSQLRTIKIDCSSIYKLVPQIDSYKSQISNQVKKALEEPDSSDNPLTNFSSNSKS